MAQVVEWLASKSQDLNTNLSAAEQTKHLL
jgi:hypothetical protein